MPGQARTHRLRANHREWTPPEIICFDTETTPAPSADGEEHSLRLWTARLDVRRSRESGGLGTARARGLTAEELAGQVDHWTSGTKTTWMYAHNVSFDLAVTRLPVLLAGLGWKVTAHAVSTDSPWLRMRKGTKVLTIADSYGWLRAPLAQVGDDVGMPKPDLPGWDDSEEAWFGRCAADTDILAEAMLALMDWWDSNHLGSWALTGSAGGWNTWRHHPGTELPLIVAGGGQGEADREAIYGGRREAWRHGKHEDGPFVLLDFRRAYTVIARDMPLPVARQGSFDSLETDSLLLDSDRYGIIAEVEIETKVPRWPVRSGGRVAYPAGRFRTVLASPEIAEARRLGCLVSIGRGYLHKLGRPMEAWAGWCLAGQDDDTGNVPAVAKRALKHWGRAVVGKTAQRGFETITYQSLGGSGWRHELAWNHERQAPSHLTEVCGMATETISCGDGENAYPAILAFVESWCRLYLSRAIEAAGPDLMISCDTDGMIVADDGTWPDRLAAADLGPLEMRAKAVYSRVDVLGPQHLTTDRDRKMSGIPPSARPAGDGRLEAMIWPKLAAQMGLRPGGTQPVFVRVWQSYSVASSYCTGWVMPDHAVKPLSAAVCGEGRTHLLPWDPRDGPRPDPAMQAGHLESMITAMHMEDAPCTLSTHRSAGTDTESIPSSPLPQCSSSPSPATRGDARAGRWRAYGGRLAARARKVFSGRTRTS